MLTTCSVSKVIHILASYVPNFTSHCISISGSSRRSISHLTHISWDVQDRCHGFTVPNCHKNVKKNITPPPDCDVAYRQVARSATEIRSPFRVPLRLDWIVKFHYMLTAQGHTAATELNVPNEHHRFTGMAIAKDVYAGYKMANIYWTEKIYYKTLD